MLFIDTKLMSTLGVWAMGIHRGMLRRPARGILSAMWCEHYITESSPTLELEVGHRARFRDGTKSKPEIEPPPTIPLQAQHQPLPLLPLSHSNINKQGRTSAHTTPQEYPTTRTPSNPNPNPSPIASSRSLTHTLQDHTLFPRRPARGTIPSLTPPTPVRERTNMPYQSPDVTCFKLTNFACGND